MNLSVSNPGGFPPAGGLPGRELTPAGGRCAHCRREELLVGSCEHGGLCPTCAAAVAALEDEAGCDHDWYISRDNSAKRCHHCAAVAPFYGA